MLDKILDSDLAGKGVIGLPDTPGLPAEEMQQKFEETAREVIIPKFNALVDELSAEGAAGNVGATGENGETTTVQAELGVLHEKAEKAKQTGTAAAENANEAKTTAAEAVEAVSEVREYVETINGKVEAAVSTNSQSLSAEKQKQARANIGAIGALEIGEMNGTVSYAVRQDLTEEQMAQARENIEVLSYMEVSDYFAYVLGGCWISFTDEDGNPTDEPYIHWRQEV